MARVAGHLSVDDLEAGFRSARDPTAARHFQAIWLLARGHTIADMAAVTSFVPRWIEQLLARYNDRGPAALGDLRRANGNPCPCAPPRASGTAARAPGRATARWRPGDRPEGCGLDGGRTRAEGGGPAAGLGGAQGDRLDHPDAPASPPARGHAGGARGV